MWHEVVKRRRNQLQPIYLFYDCLSLRSRTKTVQLKRLPLPLPGHRRSPLPPSLQLLLVAKLARTENTAWRIWQAYNATHTPSCQLSWCRSTHTHVQQCTGLQCLCRVNRVCVSKCECVRVCESVSAPYSVFFSRKRLIERRPSFSVLAPSGTESARERKRERERVQQLATYVGKHHHKEILFQSSVHSITSAWRDCRGCIAMYTLYTVPWHFTDGHFLRVW